MTDLLAKTVALMIQFRYWILFPAVVIEGPIATVVAGLLCARGYLDLTASYAVVVAADTLADVGYYALGAWGNTWLARRLESWLHITPERITYLQEHFRQRGFITFAAGKILHGPGVAVLIAAGAARVPLPQFLGYNFIVTLIKSVALVALGFYFGQALSALQNSLDMVALLASIAAVTIAAIVWWRRRKPAV